MIILTQMTVINNQHSLQYQDARTFIKLGVMLKIITAIIFPFVYTSNKPFYKISVLKQASTSNKWALIQALQISQQHLSPRMCQNNVQLSSRHLREEAQRLRRQCKNLGEKFRGGKKRRLIINQKVRNNCVADCELLQ